MGRRSTDDLTELLRSTEGVDLHNGYLRVRITVQRKRHTIPLGLEPTKPNILHAGRKYQAAKAAIRDNTFRWEIHFPGYKMAVATADRRAGTKMGPIPEITTCPEPITGHKKGAVSCPKNVRVIPC